MNHDSSLVKMEDSMGVIDLPADFTQQEASTDIVKHSPKRNEAKPSLEEAGEHAMMKVDQAISLHDKVHLHHLLSRKTLGD